VAEDARTAAGGRLEAEQHAEQRGFPGPVGADEGVHAAARQAQGQVVEGRLVPVGQAEFMGVDGVVAHAVFLFA
jgi:hypothetical protein